jgi:phosphate-selective porin
MRLKQVSVAGLAVAVAGVLAASTGAAEEEGGWHFGPGAKLSRPASGLEFALGGYAQEDFRSFHDYEDAKGQLPALGATRQLHRLRMGFDAQWKKVSFEFDYDPHDDPEHLKNLVAEVRFSKGFHVRGGNFKVPVSAEWLTSAAKTDFIERSLLAQALAPGRDWGGAVSGQPINNFHYEVGVFAGDLRLGQERAGTTVAARFEVTPLNGLDVGVSGSQGKVKGDTLGGPVDPVTHGISFHAPSGFRFYERHFVNGTRRRLGADARYHHKALGLKVEALQMTEERLGQGSLSDDLPTEVLRGFSGTATWLVTGERKARTIRPDHPLGPHGIGAVEIGARFDWLHADDNGPDEGFAGAGNRARNIRPVGGKTITGGLSWWPVYFIRLMGNAVWERYNDPVLAPVPGRKSGYVTLLGRLQLSVP